MIDRNFKVIFVCPTNKLLQSFEGEAITINILFGISFGPVKLDEFDFSEYDVLNFKSPGQFRRNGTLIFWQMC